MVRKDSVNYSKGKLTVGYGVIVLLIGAIISLYISEWRQLEKLEHVSTVYVSHRKYAYKLIRGSVQYSSPIQVNIVSLFDESSSKVYRIRTMDERFKTGPMAMSTLLSVNCLAMSKLMERLVTPA